MSIVSFEIFRDRDIILDDKINHLHLLPICRTRASNYKITIMNFIVT